MLPIASGADCAPCENQAESGSRHDREDMMAVDSHGSDGRRRSPDVRDKQEQERQDRDEHGERDVIRARGEDG